MSDIACPMGYSECPKCEHKLKVLMDGSIVCRDADCLCCCGMEIEKLEDE